MFGIKISFMKKIFSILIFGALIFPFSLFAQNKMPLITGKAKFSVQQGTIDCDLTLSEYDHIDDYLIRLNSGLNIRNIQNVENKPLILGYDRQYTDSLQKGESNAYYIPANRTGKFLPSKLRFQYTGKFPVIKDTLNMQYQRGDWRGNVAFNADILRVDGLQSAWIPILHDIKNQYDYHNLRYDIEIECLDCDYIYINGNKPAKTTKARFKSDIPMEMYLFMGKYNVQQASGVTLLNTDFSNEQLQQFSNYNSDISNFLKNYTQIKYNQEIYWVQGNNTSAKSAWSFISFPTFTTCGYAPHDLKSSLNSTYKNVFLKIIAHELGHYYFGFYKKHNNVLENVINEGFAEFLSLKYIESKGLTKVYETTIAEKLDYIKDEEFSLKPIGEFKKMSDTNDRQTFAYDYQTLVLLSIEKEIGKDKMKKWIQLLLKSEDAISNFDFFTSTLKQVINNDKIYNKVLSNFLIGNSTIKNINTLFQTPPKSK